jgi:hypothetical protein
MGLYLRAPLWCLGPGTFYFIDSGNLAHVSFGWQQPVHGKQGSTNKHMIPSCKSTGLLNSVAKVYMTGFCSVSENNTFSPDLVLLFQMFPKTRNFSLLWMKNGKYIIKG